MRTKRFLSVVLSAAMVVGSTVTASANSVSVNTGSSTNGTLSGKARMEGVVNTDVFHVIVPTTPTNASQMNFIMDPQELIKATGGERYLKTNTANSTGVSVNAKTDIEDGTVYFVNSENATKTVKLSQKSETLEIINKSSKEVDVSLNAQVKALGSVNVTDDKTFEGSVSADLYMAVVEKDGTETSISDSSAEIKQCTLEDAAKFYKKEYVSGNEGGPNSVYEYRIPSANETANRSQYPRFSFQLTGACNTKADWSKVPVTTAPEVEITYNISKVADAAPALTGSNTITVTADRGARVDLSYGKGSLAATGSSKISKIVYDNNGEEKAIPADKYLEKTDAVTFTADHVNALINGNLLPRTYTIVFNNPAKTEVQVTLNR
jgi:hypothetical protein